ncbi:hypothetical protein Lesp02_45500 [Lentzea sp. NBRC 105346]|nr:hypothetical protein Lesp02_45500 [Lentzea sp. NBRC 105346]
MLDLGSRMRQGFACDATGGAHHRGGCALRAPLAAGPVRGRLFGCRFRAWSLPWLPVPSWSWSRGSRFAHRVRGLALRASSVRESYVPDPESYVPDPESYVPDPRD